MIFSTMLRDVGKDLSPVAQCGLGIIIIELKLAEIQNFQSDFVF